MKVFFLISFLLLFFSSPAQTIDMHFPHFEGTSYTFSLIQGSETDTLATGIIPKDGKFQLNIPETHKGYKGMASWMLKTGGGLAMIINGEDFKVECLERVPSKSNIHFTGSEENLFLRVNYYEQQTLFAKHDAMLAALNIYTEKDSLYPVFQKEMQLLKKNYAGFRNALGENQLYAASFRKIADAVSGIGDVIYVTTDEQSLSLLNFITYQMNWQDLYTSGHWNELIKNWIDYHTKVDETDTQILKHSQYILNTISNDEVYTAFVETLVTHFTKTGKDGLINALSQEIKSSGKLLHQDGILVSLNAVNIGDKAPSLVFKNVNDDILSKKENVLLVFHQSDCGNCQNEIDKLVNAHKKISDKGIRIVSISADTNEESFKHESLTFPWEDKYCDLNGHSGANYTNYGVIATPTFVLIDKEGVIKARTAQLEELDIIK